MKKTVLILFIIFGLVSVGYALTVGKLTGFDYGIVVGGHTGLNGSGASTPSGDTYWDSTYTTTGDWNTAYGADWDLPYTTEIP